MKSVCSKYIYGLAVAMAIILIAGTASASSTGTVGSPEVVEGRAKAEVRLGYSEADSTSSQDERLRLRTQFDYGLTDFYAFRIIASGDKRKNDNMEAEAIAVDNRFYIFKSPKKFFHLGARAGYTFKDGDKKPDNLSFGLFERFRPGNWDIRFNQLFKHDIGQSAQSGLQFESRFLLTYRVTEEHEFGVESFNDFSRLPDLSGYSAQSHSVGPVVKGNFGDGYGYEAAYRAGISRAAPDHTFQIIFTKTFDIGLSE